MFIEDQKISFNLFEAMKHPDDSEACFEEEMLEHEIGLIASAMVLQTPVEKEFDDVTECLVSADGGEMLACIEELDDPDDESIGHVMFEELETNRPKEKPKVELKTLPAHLKYVFFDVIRQSLLPI